MTRRRPLPHLFQLAVDTNRHGGHIDGVGLQSHVDDLDTDAISADDLATAFDNVKGAGLVARISENDVDDSLGQKTQAERYATVLDACPHSDVCVFSTTRGVDDRCDFFTDDDGHFQQGHDLLLDDGEPAPAYDALTKVLTR